MASNSQPPRFRPIRAAQPLADDDDNNTTNNENNDLAKGKSPPAADIQLVESRPLAPKRASVTSACAPCRRRKVRCGGQRPRCAACISRHIDCQYDTEVNETQSGAVKRKYQELQSHATSHERVIEILRSRSQVDAEAVLRKIRRGEHMDDIARQVEHGDLLLQTSLVPEISYRYSFPLYPQMPPHLSRQHNPYLHSLIYELASPSTDSSTTESSRHSRSGHPSSAGVETAASAGMCSPYLTPYHAAEVIDPQLSSVVPSRWTAVCSDDMLMRRLMAAFLLQDHDWWTAFHKDYFLQDMARMRRTHCSSLLVNAVLALACNYYRGLSQRNEFWNPRTLGYRFLAEAKRLWEYEQSERERKLTTIQASLIFHIIYSGSGADKIGFAYLVQGSAMAHELGLFNTTVDVEDSRIRTARNYTAWALFSWQSLMCFHYFRAPLVGSPPKTPLPDPAEQPEWYGEIWLRYPLNGTQYPSHSADMFKAKGEFAVILNEQTHRLFGSDAPPGLSSAEVASYYFHFRGWYASLPESLSPRHSVLPSHLKLHMHYFQILHRLMQSPSVLAEEAATDASSRLDGPASGLAAYARANLETLLRLYYLRHGFEHLDTYLVSLLAEACIGVIEGIYEQGQSFFLGRLVFQMVKGKMSAENLKVLERFVKIDPMKNDEAKALEHVQMDWPVDITSMADDPESKSLGNLVKQFGGTSMEDSRDGAAA